VLETLGVDLALPAAGIERCIKTLTLTLTLTLALALALALTLALT
jgi:hypothetical protein